MHLARWRPKFQQCDGAGVAAPVIVVRRHETECRGLPCNAGLRCMREGQCGLFLAGSTRHGRNASVDDTRNARGAT